VMVGVDDDDVVLSLCFCLGMDVREGGVRFLFLFVLSPHPLRSGVVHSLTWV